MHNGMAPFKFAASQARSIYQYNNTITCWPEDGRLTAETCRQM